MTLRAKAAAAFPYVTGGAGVLIPVISFFSIGLGMEAAPWFSWTSNAISDLGVTARSAAVFNGGVMFAGILMVLFSLGIRRVLPWKSWFSLMVASVMFGGIGLVPENLFVVHWVLSVCFFLCFCGCFLWCSLDGSLPSRLVWSGRILLASALVALGLAIMLPGVAIPEVLVIGPGFVWCAGVAVFFLLLPALAQKKTRKYSTPAMTG